MTSARRTRIFKASACVFAAQLVAGLMTSSAIPAKVAGIASPFLTAAFAKGGGGGGGGGGGDDGGGSGSSGSGSSGSGSSGSGSSGSGSSGSGGGGNSGSGGGNSGSGGGGNSGHGGSGHGGKGGGSHSGSSGKGSSNSGKGSSNSGKGSSNSGKGSSNSGKGSSGKGSSGKGSATSSGKGSSGSGSSNSSASSSSGSGGSGGDATPVIRRDRKLGVSYVDREVVALNLGRAEIARARRLGYRVRTVRGRGAQAVQRIVPPRRVSPSAARNFLQRQFPGATVDLNHLYRLQAKGCEGEGCKWQMTLTDWSDHKQVCRPTVPIGLLDTGVDLAAIERQGHRIESARVATTGFSSASRNHGTAVTALLLGGRAQQNLALLSNAELYVADVFFEDDRGEAVTDTASLLRGLAWLRERGVKVANLSLAGPANALLEETIRSYSAEGMLFVAAAGNYGPTAPPSYPAAYNGVIAVTAVDQWEKAYSRANQGTYIRFAAPGVGLRLPTTSTRTSLQSGTSFAAPFVTAALAVMHPRTGDAALAAKLADQIQTKDLGAPGVDTVFGRGLVLAPATCAGGTMKDRAQAN